MSNETVKKELPPSYFYVYIYNILIVLKLVARERAMDIQTFNIDMIKS